MIDFAVIGQPKSGTTALAEFLSEHPDICLSVPKETGHFASDLAASADKFGGSAGWGEFRSEAKYREAFNHCKPGQVRGDASTNYLLSKDAAKNIHAANADTKIVALLRDPVAFMHSMHMQFVNETREDERDFERALAKEEARRHGKELPDRVGCPEFVLYRQRARYAPQVQRYFDTFGKDQVLILFSEEFTADNAGSYRQVLEHLGVDPEFAPDFAPINSSATPRSHKLNAVLNHPKLKKTAFNTLGPARYTAIRQKVGELVMRPQRRKPMDAELYTRLRKDVKADITELSELLGRDLHKLWH